MAIAFRSSEVNSLTSASTSLPITKPAGVVDGDALVAWIVTDDLATITPPAGWAERANLSSDVGGSNCRVAVYTKSASSEGASWTWTTGTNEFSIGTVLAFSGADAAPFDVAAIQADTSADTTMLCPSVTTTVADTMLVFGGGVDGSVSSTFPVGSTERIDVDGAVFSLFVGTEPLVASGATGTRSVTLSAGDTDIAATIALKPSGGGVAGSYRQAVLASGPVGYWRLGETSGTNANDETANNNDGTYVGTPTLNQTGAILDDANKAVTHDGTDDHVTLPDLSLGEGSTYTFECWAKWTSATTNLYMLSEGSSTDNDPIWGIIANGAVVGFFTRSTAGGTDVVDLDGTSTVNNGAWHHFVATRNGTVFTLYVDGVVEDTETYTLGSLALNRSTIGCLRRATNGSFFNGTADEVAFYNSALSGATVLAHYTAGRTAFRSLSDTVTATASANKGVKKQLSDAVAATASFIRRPRKILTGNVATTASSVKGVKKRSSATSTATASFVKGVRKSLSATPTTVASFVRRVRKTLTGDVSVSATLGHRKLVAIVLSAIVTVTSTLLLRRSLLRTLNATVTTTPTLSPRRMFRIALSAVVNIVATIRSGGARPRPRLPRFAARMTNRGFGFRI